MKMQFTSEQHLLEQAVDVRHAEQLGELDLLDHLPGYGLESRQGEQDLAEAAAALVLSVADVVLQVDLDLVAQRLDAARLAQTLSI